MSIISAELADLKGRFLTGGGGGGNELKPEDVVDMLLFWAGWLKLKFMLDEIRGSIVAAEGEGG